MDFDLIEREKARRERLRYLLDSVINSNIELSQRKRGMRRGIVQDFICRKLGVANSPDVRLLITGRMEALGYKPIVFTGHYYYANAKIKTPTQALIRRKSV